MYRQLLVVGLLLSAIAGCGARGEVAIGNFLAQVDKVLGEINLKKKEAEISVRNIEASLDKSRRGKIEAKVRLAQVNERLGELDERIALVDKTLRRLRDHLQSGEDAEINGKTYTVTEIKDMAEKVIAARKKATVEAEFLKAHQKQLERIASTFEQQEQDGRDRVAQLKLHLDEINAKAAALKSMQEAANLSGNPDTIDFESVEKQVRDISTKIDVELDIQIENINGAATTEKSLATIVRQISTPTDTVSKIDKLIGPK